MNKTCYTTQPKTFQTYIQNLKPGTWFLPIVSEGREYYFRDGRGRLLKGHGRILLDRAHQKVGERGTTVCRDRERNKDAIFSMRDKCIVMVGFQQRLNLRRS